MTIPLVTSGVSPNLQDGQAAFNADADVFYSWFVGRGANDMLGQLDRFCVSGSGASGNYAQLADGTQYCWHHDDQLSYDTGGTIRVAWTYPAAFVAEPAVVACVNMSGLTNNATPANTEVLHPRYNVRTSSQVVFTSFRISGMTDFQSGDYAEVSLFAVGRWY